MSVQFGSQFEEAKSKWLWSEDTWERRSGTGEPSGLVMGTQVMVETTGMDKLLQGK